MKKVIEVNNVYIFPTKVWLNLYDEEGFYKGMLVDNSADVINIINKEKVRAQKLIISTPNKVTIYEGDLDVKQSLDRIINHYGIDSKFKINLIQVLNNYKNLIDDEKEINKVKILIKDAEKILK